MLVTGIQQRRVCGAGKSSSSPMTWSGWIPVTGIGMREAGMHGLCNFRLRIREGMFNLLRNERLRLHSRIEAKRNTVYGRDP
ncbi:hypothetical protein CDO25_01585 [Sinorhizobium meliloti]|nr:hypothetical protein CDO25_01585 [Sinorhizobium meliloti]